MAIEFSEVIKQGAGTMPLGVENPKVNGVAAGAGTVGKSLDGSYWLKGNGGDTDWGKLSPDLIDPLTEKLRVDLLPPSFPAIVSVRSGTETQLNDIVFNPDELVIERDAEGNPVGLRTSMGEDEGGASILNRKIITFPDDVVVSNTGELTTVPLPSLEAHTVYKISAMLFFNLEPPGGLRFTMSGLFAYVATYHVEAEGTTDVQMTGFVTIPTGTEDGVFMQVEGLYRSGSSPNLGIRFGQASAGEGNVRFVADASMVLLEKF